MTTNVESFGDGTLHQMGAIYPFLGSEGMLVIIVMAVWIVWHIWQLKNEAEEYNVETEEIKDKAQANRVLEPDAGRKVA